MDYKELLTGKGEPLTIYSSIALCLENIEAFPTLLELIYRNAMALDEEKLHQLRFGLLRLQVFADIHRTEDMERAEKIKYISQVLEKVIFGNLMLEKEQYPAE